MEDGIALQDNEFALTPAEEIIYEHQLTRSQLSEEHHKIKSENNFAPLYERTIIMRNYLTLYQINQNLD